MNYKCILTILFITTMVANAWFDPYPDAYGKVIITRANTYETYPTNIDVFATNQSLVNVPFFDAGDTNTDITWQYGGDKINTFDSAYPITLYVWFQTNGYTEIEGGGYKEAKIQYYKGTNTFSSTNWTTIATLTNMRYIMGVQGAHFGFLNWIPPDTTNMYYLVRMWTVLSNGWQNASLTSTGIDKDGNNSFDWNDYEVLLLKSINYIKPGVR